MSYDITPKKVQDAVQRGRKRLRNFRNSRVMFLRNYVGQYYDKETGQVGVEALNMIFNAIRALVPHLCMSFPTHKINSNYLAMKDYAELLSLALSLHDKKLDIKTSYRRVITDAIFTVGIMKTGLARSESLYALDPSLKIDAGTIYSTPVDFDDFIVDPKSRAHLFSDAGFLGDSVTISRELLLSTGLFKNDLIERLPRCGKSDDDRASSLSMRGIEEEDNYGLEDDVEIIELWVPAAKTILYLPGDDSVEFDDYLRIDDYFGVDEGPYTFLSLTPPVPGNPLPIPMVGIWNDLHILANKMAAKIVEQAMSQKDVFAYKRASADDAQEFIDAKNGEAIAMDDPEAVRVISAGGQQQSNEVHLAQLQAWFNLMAGNPDQLTGSRPSAGTATQEKILAGNATVGLDDMKDLVYAFAAEEARKRAWLIHTDPLMQIPLVRRVTAPPQMIVGPTGAPFMQPPIQQEQQVILTPEMRRGDFLDFMFSIEPESMGRRDSTTRFAQCMDFCVKFLPAVLTAAQAAMVIGLPFSAKVMLEKMAKLAGIDWMDEVFADPQLQMQMMQMMMMGPQMANSKGQVAGGGQQPPNADLGGGGMSNMMGQILQNGQPSSVMSGQPGPTEQMNSGFQDGANEGQQMVQRGY
jgi:hypothetical protein